jgi:hypothetical protein
MSTSSGYYWLNRFNGVEGDGPFAEPGQARDDAVATMLAVQDGFAFDIAVTCGRGGPVVESGHIKGGRWFCGDFSETAQENADRLGLPTRPLAAHTVTDQSPYPGYVSLNARGGAFTVTVRGDSSPEGIPGATVHHSMTRDELILLVATALKEA